MFVLRLLAVRFEHLSIEFFLGWGLSRFSLVQCNLYFARMSIQHLSTIPLPELCKAHKVKPNVPAIVLGIRSGPVYLVQMLVNAAGLFAQVCWQLWFRLNNGNSILWEAQCNTSQTECRRRRRGLWIKHRACSKCSTHTVTTVIIPIAILVSKLPEAVGDCYAGTLEKWNFFFPVNWFEMTSISK